MQNTPPFPIEVQREIQQVVHTHGNNRHARRAVAALARKGHRLAARRVKLRDVAEANRFTSAMTPGDRIAMRRWIEEQDGGAS